MINKQFFFYFIFLYILSSHTWADGSSIDKVYVPYVQYMEKEIEYRVLMENDNVSSGEYFYLHKLGYGQAIKPGIFMEAYIISSDEAGREVKTEAYELEIKLQLTEQGEYRVDWGAILELEKYAREDIWEAKLGALAATELGKTTHTFNFYLINEWGDDVDNEFETAFSYQGLYRWSPALEPGVEVFASEDTSAIGPMLTGQIKLQGTHKLFWHGAVFHGLNDDTANNTLKLQLEYEFI